MPKTTCIECDAVIRVDDPVEGDIIVCPECGVELEIIDIDPLDVDYPLDDDWEEDDWEDED
ncbi:MAG TPA: lysine biosynthesis protein LysW [Chloroflexi bacterium]|nr:lysine biosynthesis protein LysW [Chloroflexota bacterium]